jgi:hypothetical protein
LLCSRPTRSVFVGLPSTGPYVIENPPWPVLIVDIA